MVALATAILLASAANSQIDPARLPSRSPVEEFGKSLGAAEISGARPLLRLALELIKDFEGWVPRAYDDPANYCTIGYGHLIALRKCAEVTLGAFAGELSEAEGVALLERDTVPARLAVQNLVTANLNEEQFGALSAFVFNVGQYNFARSTMLKLLNSGDYDLAAGQFARWVRAKGRILPGLVARRACEEALFRQQLAFDRSGRFNRSQCYSLGAAPEAGALIDIEVGE